MSVVVQLLLLPSGTQPDQIDHGQYAKDYADGQVGGGIGMTAWQEPENCGHIRAKQIRAIDRYGIQAHHKSHAAGRGILRNPELVIGGNKGHTHIQQRHPRNSMPAPGARYKKK